MSFIGATGLNTFDEEIENTSNYATRIILDSSNYILDTSNIILLLLEILPYEKKLSVPTKGLIVEEDMSSKGRKNVSTFEKFIQ